MAEPILVLGGGPAAALATLRLAELRLPVRAIPGPPSPIEDSGVERLGPLPSAEPLLGNVPVRRVVSYRHCLAASGPTVSLEYREAPSPASSRLLRRGDLTATFLDAARGRGAVVDSPGNPVAVTARPGALPEVTSGSELLRPPALILSDPALLVGDRGQSPSHELLWRRQFELPPDRIEARFGIRPGEGAVVDALLPPPVPGRGAGGYVRAGPSSISVGLLLRERNRTPTPEEARASGGQWLRHPIVAPLIAGANGGADTVVEVPPVPPRPARSDACICIGRAAGLLVSNGLEPRGIGAELASAELAAALFRPRASGVPSARVLQREWREAWHRSGAIQSLRRWAQRSERFKWKAGLEDALPRFATEAVHELMTETGAPKRRVGASIRSVARTGRHPRIRLLRATLSWMEAL